MPSIGVHTDVERLQKRWIFGALAIALVVHAIVAWALGWYKIPRPEIPYYNQQTAPFVVKQIEINPDALKSPQDDPIAHLPVATPPANPAQFNLDPNVIERALQTPQPALAMPSVPEPSRVIAATDLTRGLPYAESDSAQISADIARVEPAAGGGPLASSKLADQLINAGAGPAQPGIAAGAPLTGNGAAAGKLPGFAQLAPGFKTAGPDLSNLPEPVLLRLPSDVLFDFDSARLKPEADSLLSQAVGLITKYPQADVRIDGYTDSFGQPDYNATLSQQRAQAVQDWLEDRIPQAAYKFRSAGHGSSNYVVSPQGAIDQQQPNRRVEILIQALKP
ncbi:MAG TPA: OmpA family protein [Candidatus Methylacidiphilales bacterium]|jgi:outer membrane protein OmpA-like peptidoglycan-associated protein|nr:OmpA family protein [Candidatus Methylacidiphilales bacterium]